MGPLSAKQHREMVKFASKEAREKDKYEREEARKEQLHELKMQEVMAKANQGITHKEELHQQKVAPLAGGSTDVKPLRINRQKLGLPSMNPIADTEVLGRGQKRLPGMQPMGTDTVPAMLTPGEAVIPAPAAQNPKNKKAIARMVEEGRNQNRKTNIFGFATGTVDVPNMLANLPTIGSRNKRKGYADGSINIKPENEGLFTAKASDAGMSVQEFANKVLSAPLGKYDPDTRKQANFARNAAGWQHHMNGTTNVKYYVDGTEDANSFDRDKFFRITSALEASNNPNSSAAINPNTGLPYSSAIGLLGTTKGAYNLYQKAYPELRDVEFGSDEFKSPGFQQNLLDYMVMDRRKQLESKNIPVNYSSMYAAGFGPRGVEAYSAENSTPLNKLFSEEELKANVYTSGPNKGKSYFGETAGDFKKFIDNKVNKELSKFSQAESQSAKNISVPPTTKQPTVVPPLYSNDNPEWSRLSPEQKQLYKSASKLVDALSPSGQPSSADLFQTQIDDRNRDLAIRPVNKAGYAQGPLVYQSTGEPVIAKLDPEKIAITGKPIPQESILSADELRRLHDVKQGKPEAPIAADTLITGTPEGLVTDFRGGSSFENVPPKLLSQDELKRLYDVKEGKPEAPPASGVLPLQGQPEGIVTNFRDGDSLLSQVTKENINDITKVVEQAKTTEDPKGFLSGFLSNLYGDKGVFNSKDLARFAIVAAGGILSGGSVGGSIRYAGRDTLAAADRRAALEASDERALRQLKAVDDRTLRGKLIDQGYDIKKIDAYLKSGKQEDLGDPRTNYSYKETTKQLTFDRGPLMGQVFNVVEATQKTGKSPGSTVLMAIEPKSGKKIPLTELQSMANQSGFSIVDYEASRHSSQARLKATNDWIEGNKSIEEKLDLEYGSTKTKDNKPNPNRQGVPVPSAIKSQAASFFTNKGYSIEDKQSGIEMNNILDNAVQEMIMDKKNRNLTSVNSIEPYLSRSYIQINNGINPDVFKVGTGTEAKLMAPEKLTSLDNLARQASVKLNKGEYNQATYTGIYKNMYKAWVDNPSLRNQYKGTSNESAFYMYMKDKLQEALK